MKPHEARTRADLITACNSGVRAKFLFFWGHTPPTDGSVNKACLSQWYHAPFTHAGRDFATAEHFMMFHKAKLFKDHEIAEQVLCAPSPGAAKALGRSVRNFRQDAWEKACFAIVTQANVEKFGQSDDLRQYLIGTGKRILVEASPKDRIWGIGLDEQHEHAGNPAQWRGDNLLGFALMAARDILSQEADRA